MEMQNKKLVSRKPSESTQKYLDLSEVRDDTIVMKDGSLRAVIAVSSTNFSLKSEEEQNAITAAYQSFLNSLDFPLQILIHSRVLDINGYLEKLRLLAGAQTNELLRIQMNEYIEFVGKLVEFASIMSKNFYVVVPYSAGPAAEGWLARLKRVVNPVRTISAKQEDFLNAKAKLEERVSDVTSKLSAMGLRSTMLTTPELVELIYASYNFNAASPFEGESLDEVELESPQEVS